MSDFPTTLKPVVAPTDESISRKDHVGLARRAARAALDIASELAGVRFREYDFDERGAPLPQGRWHRSTAHTRGLAAAVVAPAPVGIDVERLDRPRVQQLLPRTLDDIELAFLPVLAAEDLLRIWTAKEAVLKMRGVGLAELSTCRLAAAFDASETTTRVHHRDSVHLVHTRYLDERGREVEATSERAFVLSLVCDGEVEEVEFTLLDIPVRRTTR